MNTQTTTLDTAAWSQAALTLAEQIAAQTRAALLKKADSDLPAQEAGWAGRLRDLKVTVKVSDKDYAGFTSAHVSIAPTNHDSDKKAIIDCEIDSYTKEVRYGKSEIVRLVFKKDGSRGNVTHGAKDGAMLAERVQECVDFLVGSVLSCWHREVYDAKAKADRAAVADALKDAAEIHGAEDDSYGIFGACAFVKAGIRFEIGEYDRSGQVLVRGMTQLSPEQAARLMSVAEFIMTGKKN
jgi:hypothetical protein